MALSNWRYFKTITIDSSLINSDLTNFPLLIKLDSSNFPFSLAKSDGTDIRFSSDRFGENLLEYERDYYSESLQKAFFWVKVPSISSTSDTVIYLFFGNSFASDSENAEAVWESNYKIVLHMNDNDVDETIINDSTSNGNDGQKLSLGNPIEIDFDINKGQLFDGSNDYIDISSNVVSTNVSLSIYLQSSQSGTNKKIIDSNNNRFVIYWLDPNTGAKLGIYDGNNIYLFNTNAPNDGLSHFLTYVINGTNISLYLDGVYKEVLTFGTSFSWSNSSIRIGSQITSAGDYFEGKIDEFFLYNGSLSSDYIKAMSNNLFNTFISISSEYYSNFNELFFRVI